MAGSAKDSSTPVAVVTGAGGGIGRSTCLALAEDGYAVVVSDIGAEAVGETAALVQAAGGRVLGVVCDVTKPADVEALFAAVERDFGRLDAAVNNAGIAPQKGEFTTVPEEEWSAVMEVNAAGVWRCMKAEIALMSPRGSGSIVNLSSRTGLYGSAGRAVYSASKHAVIGLTRSAALEFAAAGLRINTVCPGPIRTDIIGAAVADTPDRLDRLAASTAMNRIGEPAEVAGVIRWLCSPAASFVTGVEIPVDGGVARGVLPVPSAG